VKNLHIQIQVNKELYLKDPDSSELGRKIISKSIEMIDEMGFEDFTFKKLGLQIHSPESSIYRYFESKHALLIYLTSWYWTWTEYRLVFATSNVSSPRERLKISIDILTMPVKVDQAVSHVNEILLSEIIFSESLKAYHTKNVDKENNKGYFEAYKSVVQRVSEIILEVDPNFEFPHMLISTVIEGAHHQKYFSDHLPSLTDSFKGKNVITDFYQQLVFNFLK
jgi:AcrR family transcriptional regulator